MSIFKKRGSGDVLDLTDMQRRGILKKSAEVEKSFAGNADSSGYFDFTGSSRSAGASGSTASGSSSGSSGNQFDFLDALASTSGASAGSGGSGADSLEIQGLKNKIDDLGYKLQVLEDKIAKLGS